MARVKRGVTSRRRHHKVLKLTEGHRASKHTLFRRANESMFKALSYAFRHRRERKGDFRRLWIARINAAARLHGLGYADLMHGLKQAGVEVDRKVLADLAVSSPAQFAAIVRTAQESA